VFGDPEVEFAVRAVREASRLVRQVQAELVLPSLVKDDRSPVTVADFAAQALVARLLEVAFPGAPLVAEESSVALRAATASDQLEQVTQFISRQIPGASPERVCRWIDLGAAGPSTRFWTLDPVDGTKGFLRGNQYAVALALIERGQVAVGVLGCPHLAVSRVTQRRGPGLLIVAARKRGSWAIGLDEEDSPVRLRVSDQADPASARLLRSFEAGHTNTAAIDELVGRLGIHGRPVLMDSQAKFAVLAAGDGDVLLRLLSPTRPDYREKIWDQAAGSLVVEEAGGRVTDLTGRPLDFTTGRTLTGNVGVVATNGHLHEGVLAALAQVRTPLAAER